MFVSCLIISISLSCLLVLLLPILILLLLFVIISTFSFIVYSILVSTWLGDSCVFFPLSYSKESHSMQEAEAVHVSVLGRENETKTFTDISCCFRPRPRPVSTRCFPPTPCSLIPLGCLFFSSLTILFACVRRESKVEEG